MQLTGPLAIGLALLTYRGRPCLTYPRTSKRFAAALQSSMRFTATPAPDRYPASARFARVSTERMRQSCLRLIGSALGSDRVQSVAS